MATEYVTYILESPGPHDLAEGRREGEALLGALQLAKINAVYFDITDLNMLITAFAKIIADCSSNSMQKQILPVLHFSAHGNKDGIALTSNEFVSWELLGNFLYNLKDEMKVEKDKHGWASIAMSTCSGLFGGQIAKENMPAPFHFLVGSMDDIIWTDGLTAWITFYHLFFRKQQNLGEVIKAMNIAAGLPPKTFYGMTAEQAMMLKAK